MTTKETKALLNEHFGAKDDRSCVTFSKGLFTVRRGFFYPQGRTSVQLVQSVMAVVPNAEVVDHGEVWKAFKGGANTKNQSHWFVKLRVN